MVKTISSILPLCVTPSLPMSLVTAAIITGAAPSAGVKVCGLAVILPEPIPSLRRLAKRVIGGNSSVSPSFVKTSSVNVINTLLSLAVPVEAIGVLSA